MIAWVVLALTPVGLADVRVQAREHNSAAILAELTHANALEQKRLATSAILPQVYLSAQALDNVQGPQNQTSVTPQFDTSDFQNFLNSLANPTYVRRTVTIPTSSYAFFDTSLNVQQLIYDGGKWWNAIAQAGDQERAAQNQYDEQRNVSESEGVRRFYELFRAEKSAQVLRATVQRSTEQLDRARSMFEAGRALKGDVYAAQVTLGNDEISLRAQLAAVNSASADLAIWLGRPGTDALTAIDPGVLEATPENPAELQASITLARQNRPLLRALVDQVHASDLGITIARGGFLPRLSAGAAVGRNGPGVDPVYTSPRLNNYANVGLQLRWDLFSGFMTDAQVQQARIAKRQAEVNLAQATIEVEDEARRWLGYQAYAVERWKIARVNQDAASENLTLASERYKAGAGSHLDIQDAQLKLTQAELTVLSSRIDIEIARANVDRVVGRSGVLP